VATYVDLGLHLCVKGITFDRESETVLASTPESFRNYVSP